MKNVLKLDTIFSKIEFWVFTTIFAFILFFFITDSFTQSNAPYEETFKEAGVPFHFYENFFIPQLFRNLALFLSVVFLNFSLVPRIAARENLSLNLLFVLFTFIMLGVVFGLTDYYFRGYLYGNSDETAVQRMFSQGLEHVFITFSVFSIYTAIKYICLNLLRVSGKLQARFPFVRPEAIVATFIWAIVLLFVVSEGGSVLGTIAWIMAVPTAILLYLAGFHTLIPSSLNKKHPFLVYAFKNLLILFVALMGWGLILKLVVGSLLQGDKAPLAALWIFNSVLQMFVTVPVTWWLYKRHLKGNEQLQVLKKELDQSNASFDFLRSQINPHFLFNALNTIYGTALQEGAERTGEAVQKLGDMMRFMLQENMQEKISLSREIDYLNNYISLQKLRTDSHSDITIETNIQSAPTGMQVAPMLLIPFVENAFKHGISFREPSYISIMLHVKDGVLHFDVKNNKHPKPANDPEADKSGIGLGNVRQRLQHMYPRRHELLIHETTTEFSVHLAIETI